MAALGACLLFLLGGSGPARADTVRQWPELFEAISVMQYVAVYLFVPMFLCPIVCSERDTSSSTQASNANGLLRLTD